MGYSVKLLLCAAKVPRKCFVVRESAIAAQDKRSQSSSLTSPGARASYPRGGAAGAGEQCRVACAPGTRKRKESAEKQFAESIVPFTTIPQNAEQPLPEAKHKCNLKTKVREKKQLFPGR